jgi:hypothetical protein
MVVPPQGVGGGAPIDTGALEDSYIARFKALDPKVAKMFEYAEVLVSAGILNVDDVAKYSNILSAPTVAQYCNSIFSASFAASLFANTNVTASRVATILNDNNITVSKAAAILNSVNISSSRVKQILTDTNITANRVQDILYSMADQGFYDKLLDIMTLDASNASYTSNTTLSTGVNIYRNLSISSGVTLTLGASPGVIVAYSITNNGTIASGWVKGAGGASYSGPGGNGSGAVIILASNISVGTVTANGANGSNGTYTSVYFAGGAGGYGNFLLISGDSALYGYAIYESIPYGGNGGGSNGGAGARNGGAGGGTNSYKGGDGGSSTTITCSKALSIISLLFKSICDWWLVNVVNKSPSVIVSIPSLGGSGGGGGSSEPSVGQYAGGGGGGGGQIIIYGTSVSAGTVLAKGGSGGYAGTISGGGGGGGVIYVYCVNLTGTFTYDVSGGAAGGGTATAGNGGVFRIIRVGVT